MTSDAGQRMKLLVDMNLSDTTKHWVALREGPGLGAAVRAEAHYAQLLWRYINSTGGVSARPLARLARR